MADEVAALSIRLEASAARFERDMQRATRSMQAATGRMERSASSLDKRLSETGARFGLNIPTRATAVTAAIAGIGLALREVVKAGEEMRSIEGRFTALTGSAERAGGLVQSVLGVSSRTGDTLSTVTDLQASFLLAAREVGATDAEVGRFTESLLKLGRIGGSSTASIENGTRQLAQGLSGGIIRAEEFNSLMENTPLIVDAIAQAMGLTLGQLRQLMLDGNLLAKDVFAAILSQSEKIDAKFQDIPQTADQAWTRISNGMTQILSQLDQASGLSQAWVSVLNGVADVMERIASASGTVDASVAKLTDTERAKRLRDVQLNIRTAMLAGNEDALIALRREEAALTANNGMTSHPGYVVPGTVPAVAGNPYASNAAYTQAMVDLYSAAGRGAPAAGPAAAIDVLHPTPPKATSGGSTLRATDVDRAVARLQDMTRAMTEQANAVGLTDEALVRYQASVEAANLIVDASAKATPEQVARLEALGASYVEAAVSAERLKAAEEARTDAAELAAETNERLVDTFSGAISQADSFADALRNVAMALVEMAAKGAFLGEGPLGGLQSVLTTVATSAVSPAAGPSVAAQYGLYGAGKLPARASGGPVVAGQAYMVGEHGPEPFVPAIDGRVLSVSQAQAAVRGGGGAHVRLDVNVNDDGTLGVIARQAGASAALPVAVSVTRSAMKASSLKKSIANTRNR